MPVVIEEVIADIQEPVTQANENLPAAEQQPLDKNEADLADTLARIRQRQQRLQVD
ncbi:hypothetical protein GCM10011348_02920 [Marinobacterium nitratireducens]|uniref:Uncharacterized protein n=1 Tax=Marinobacterium nitratireducens TaxID=518897 RepID=A0A917Z6M3_9GAMM|nr:hypothetical protein [Marinobacterium nitratireducens]GGO76224.1 hypothetical protein GCM10011348_02920 [Marinobacterium nitratireducens]